MSPTIEGALEYHKDGAPVNGTNEVETLTIGGTPTSGTFKLAYDGQVTAAITWSATTGTLIANVQAALQALANVGSGGMVVTNSSLSNGIGDMLITFGGNLAKKAVNTVSVYLNSLAGTLPTLAVAKTTPGVHATFRGASIGALLLDTTNSALYENTGTALEPTWTLIGTVSTGTVTEAMLVPGAAITGLSGLVAKFVAAANVIGGIPVIHWVHVTAGANGDTNVVLTHKTKVMLVIAHPTTSVASATLQVKNGANAITDAMATPTANAVVLCASIDPTREDIAAGGTLRVTGAGGATMPAADVFVLGFREA